MLRLFDKMHPPSVARGTTPYKVARQSYAPLRVAVGTPACSASTRYISEWTVFVWRMRRDLAEEARPHGLSRW
jgi:hypothetical protein